MMEEILDYKIAVGTIRESEWRFHQSELTIKEILEKDPSTLHWEYISKQKLPIEFILHFKDFISINCLVYFNVLSEKDVINNLIYKFNDRTWGIISARQKLSEEFIEKYKDNLDWFSIGYSQKLSDNFIIKHFDRLSLHLDYLLLNDNISNEIKEYVRMFI